MAIEKCSWCRRFFKADELTNSDHHGGKVCASCWAADQGPDQFPDATKMIDLGEIQASKRAAAVATAWNNGEGWGE